jgi:hypothetical protein
MNRAVVESLIVYRSLEPVTRHVSFLSVQKSTGWRSIQFGMSIELKQGWHGVLYGTCMLARFTGWSFVPQMCDIIELIASLKSTVSESELPLRSSYTLSEKKKRIEYNQVIMHIPTKKCVWRLVSMPFLTATLFHPQMRLTIP